MLIHLARGRLEPSDCNSTVMFTSHHQTMHSSNTENFSWVANGWLSSSKISTSLLTFILDFTCPSRIKIWTYFPGSTVDKEFTCNAGDPGSIPQSGRSPAEAKSYPFQYSGLENSRDRGALDFHVHFP